MSDHIVFVRFLPFYTPAFPYDRIIHCSDEDIGSVLLTLRDEWWCDPPNRNRLHRARIERQELQLRCDALAAGLNAHVLTAQASDQPETDGEHNAKDAPPAEAIPSSVRASLVRLNAVQNAGEGEATRPPGFEEIATVAGWMQPLPSSPPDSRHLTKFASPAASPPEFRNQRIVDAAAPWSMLPSLDAFPPHRISARYAVFRSKTREFAGDVAAALQMRVSELTRGARDAHDRDDLEIWFGSANPRFFVVAESSLSRPEMITAREQIQRVNCDVTGAPSAEERFLRVYSTQIRQTLDQFDVLTVAMDATETANSRQVHVEVRETPTSETCVESSRKPGRPRDENKPEIVKYVADLRKQKMPWKSIPDEVFKTFRVRLEKGTLQDYLKKAKRGKME